MNANDWYESFSHAALADIPETVTKICDYLSELMDEEIHYDVENDCFIVDDGTCVADWYDRLFDVVGECA